MEIVDGPDDARRSVPPDPDLHPARVGPGGEQPVGPSHLAGGEHHGLVRSCQAVGDVNAPEHWRGQGRPGWDPCGAYLFPRRVELLPLVESDKLDDDGPGLGFVGVAESMGGVDVRLADLHTDNLAQFSHLADDVLS